MADVAALVFDIDSSQARGAAKALTDLNSAAIKAANSAASIGTTMRDANGRFQQAAKLTAENLHEVKSLAKAYNPLIAAQIQYRDEAIRTSAAVKAGVISDKDRATYLKRLKSELDGTASAERKAASAREAARREFLPLYAASKEYEATLGRLNAALKAGDISTAQHAAALKRINDQYASSAAAVNKFSQSQQVARHHVANLSFQLNDIGMMMAMGQNPFMLMMQQGPQVAQIFSQMNAEGRKLGPTLAGAFKMFLNPTTAVTLALIGASAALGQWAMSAIGAESDTRSLEDSIGDMNDSLANIKKYSDISKKSIFELSQEFGTYAWSIRDSAKALVELERAEHRSSIIKSIKAAREEFGELGVDIDGIRAKLDALPDNLRFGAAASPLIASLSRAEQKVADLAGQLGISNQAAEEFSASLMRLGGARTFQEMESELRNVREIMQRFNVDAGLLPEEIRNAIIEWERLNIAIGQSSGEISKATSQTLAWQNAMSGVLGYINAIGRSLSSISGSGINLAAIRAEREALSRGESLEQAALAGERSRALSESRQRTHELEKQHGIMGRMLGIAESATKQYEISEAAALAADRKARQEADRAAAKAESGGGGAAERRAAAELKAAEKGFQNIRELLEKESLFQVAEWEKRQKQLDAALAKDLLTRENYELMKQQLQQHYFGTEYQRKQVQYDMDLQQLRAALEAEMITRQQYAIMAANLHSQQVSQMGAADANIYSQHLANLAGHFGEMNAIAGGGYDSLLKAQRVFGAASALISTYQGAAKALELPFPYNMAAMAKVLAAGMGMVNAIKSGGSSKGAGASSSAAVRQEPTRNVLVRMEGPDWMQDIAESVITQIFDQSKDGRVIISRDY